ncbi:MAG: hypothetical protein U0T81_03160 [Saprospiraceae bacterium]
MSDLWEFCALALKRRIEMRFERNSSIRIHHFLLLHLLILSFSLNAQQDSISEGSVNGRGGGVGSLRGNFSKQFKSIDKYALVVGISDYADPGSPTCNLRIAMPKHSTIT